MSEVRSRKDRLDAILEKVCPKVMEFHRSNNGQWPDGQCPYVIRTVPGGRSVTVVADDGDTRRGAGVALDDALAALEAKL